MPIALLLNSAAGTCPFCNQKSGILYREHSQCRHTRDAGLQEMTLIAAEAARTHQFDEKNLRFTPA